jgi:hypothetical protein
MGIAEVVKAGLDREILGPGVEDSSVVFWHAFASCGSALALYCNNGRTTLLCSGYGFFGSAVTLNGFSSGWMEWLRCLRL